MKIHLLHTNDVHSHLENYMRIGAAMRALRNQIRALGETVFTFDIGDVVDRVRPETEATNGRINAAMMGALEYDGWVFGNNEGLTIPTQHWAEMVETSGTTVFGTNFRTPEGSPFPFFTDWRVYTRNGVRLGVFGLSPQYEKAYEILGVQVLHPFEQAAKAVAALRAEGADAIVLLSHLGRWTDRQLAESVTGIDVILGGHTHDLMKAAECVNDTWIYQAGKHAQAFGLTVIEADESTRRVRRVDSRYVPLNPKASMDDPMVAAYTAAIPEMEEVLRRPVVHLQSPLHASYTEECALANLLVDAMKDAYPCDLGVMMSGALTASLLSGQVRRGDVHAACLTPTKPLLMTLRGDDIRRILEKSLLPEFYERLGFGYGFRGSVIGRMALAGVQAEVERLTTAGPWHLKTVMVGGEALEDGRLYRVVTSEYLWLSNVYKEFRHGTHILIQAPLVRELLLNHLKCDDNIRRANQPRWVECHSHRL